MTWEVIAAVKMLVGLLSCNAVWYIHKKQYLHLVIRRPEDGSSIFLRNADIKLLIHTTLQPRRPQISTNVAEVSGLQCLQNHRLWFLVNKKDMSVWRKRKLVFVTLGEKNRRMICRTDSLCTSPRFRGFCRFTAAPPQVRVVSISDRQVFQHVSYVMRSHCSKQGRSASDSTDLRIIHCVQTH